MESNIRPRGMDRTRPTKQVRVQVYCNRTHTLKWRTVNVYADKEARTHE